MDNLKNEKNINSSYSYLECLDDNEPKAEEKDYGSEAKILHEKIDMHHVSNIAVVAKYGAGKSSAINTYLSLYRNKGDKIVNGKKVAGKPSKNHYARISLSTFNNESYNEVSIERSILQQLLYSTKKRDLPKSKIERTNKTPFAGILLWVFLMLLTVTSAAFFILDISNTYLFKISGISLRWYLFGLAFIGSIIIFTVLLYYRKIKSFKYKDIEADFEIDENNRTVEVKNLINKFIDEVLYFFECVNINLVIFEDLDRLENTEIFAKLRELNTIINQNGISKKVTFLYAVKDDMFKKAEERAKFFDFILPIIPIINPVTTKDHIVKLFNAIKDERLKISERFIQNIALYIPDMRILKNTFNDYLIMFSKIFEDKNNCKYLDKEKLFALCLYKNLYPYDYAELEMNQGLIPMVIDVKKIQDNISEEVRNKIIEINDKMKRLSEESLNSFEELRCMFAGQLMKMPDDYYRSGDINVANIKTFENLNFRNLNHPTRGYRIKLSDYQDEILTPSGDRYIDREKSIRIKEEKKEKELQEELKELARQRNRIYRLGFTEIIDMYGKDICLKKDIKERYIKTLGLDISASDKELTNSANIRRQQVENSVEEQIKYLEFLVTNKYIDEHYIEYTSNYHSAVLSPSDTRILRSIKNRDVDYDANIENVKNVISWLDEDDFKQYSILNNTIIDNIAIVRTDSKNKYNNLIELLSNISNDHVLEFLEEYCSVSSKERMYVLFEQLIKKNIEVCADIVSKSEKSDLKDVSTASAIMFCKDFDKANKNDVLSNYIKSYENYWDIFDSVSDSKKVIDFITQQKVIVHYVSIAPHDLEIHNCIINDNHYEINLYNLAGIFKVDMSDTENDFFKSNYTVLQNSDMDAVKKYIHENVNIYAEKVLLNEKVSLQNEEKSYLLQLIKNSDINKDIKEKLLAKYSNPFIENIKEIENNLYKGLFENNCVVSTWENILYAYKVLGYDCISNYLAKEKEYVGTYIANEELKDSAYKLFAEMLNKLDSETLEHVLSLIDISRNLSQFDTTSITDQNLSIAINKDKIKYDNGDFQYLFKKPLSLLKYIVKYEDKILVNHQTFFNDAYPEEVSNYYSSTITYRAKSSNAQEMIANVLACKGISVKIKETLVEKCKEIIKIDGHERAYVDYILSDKQAVPLKILWQIGAKNDSVVSKEEKLLILWLCLCKTSEPVQKADVAKYLNTIYEGIDKAILSDTKYEIDMKDINMEIMFTLKELKILDCSKKRRQDKLVIRAYK